jgi:preprotein translocase subunit SecA
MLSVIDQHWREHLYEMDYLREGINLRAMGQRDPLAEWQREGFDMFEAMMAGIEDDFVRFVTHLEVVAEEPTQGVRNVKYSAAEDPVQGSSALRAAAVAAPAAELDAVGGMGGTATALADPELETGEEIVNTPVRVDKTPGRNDPCFCGSGKKFKLCHGR